MADNSDLRLEGAPASVASVEKNYEHVASLYSLDAMFVHSWHAGIHPGCEFNNSATNDLVRWSGSAFGSPRILHFHTCGDFAPARFRGIFWIRL